MIARTSVPDIRRSERLGGSSEDLKKRRPVAVIGTVTLHVRL